MSIPVEVGKPIPLELNLETDPLVTKYVRAHLSNINGNALPGSPVLLGAISNKKYIASTPYLMPNELYITAIYEVANDASFLDLSDTIGDAEDRFISTQVTGTGGIVNESQKGLTAYISFKSYTISLKEIPIPYKGLTARVNQINNFNVIPSLTGKIKLDFETKSLTGRIKHE